MTQSPIWINVVFLVRGESSVCGASGYAKDKSGWVNMGSRPSREIQEGRVNWNLLSSSGHHAHVHADVDCEIGGTGNRKGYLVRLCKRKTGGTRLMAHRPVNEESNEQQDDG